MRGHSAVMSLASPWASGSEQAAFATLLPGLHGKPSSSL